MHTKPDSYEVNSLSKATPSRADSDETINTHHSQPKNLTDKLSNALSQPISSETRVGTDSGFVNFLQSPTKQKLAAIKTNKVARPTAAESNPRLHRTERSCDPFSKKSRQPTIKGPNETFSHSSSTLESSMANMDINSCSHTSKQNSKNCSSQDAVVASNGSTAQAQPVPPPVKFSSNPLKKSMQAFPLQDPLRREKKDAPKRTSSMEKLKAWRASASDFFNAIVKHRSNSSDGIHPTDESTGGEAVEDGAAPQEPKPKKNFILALNTIGTALMGSGPSGTTSSAASSSKQSPMKSDARPEKHLRPQENVARLFQRKVPEEATPKEAQKDRKIDEVTAREIDIAGFLSGSKPLSNRFSQRYKLGEVLGEGAFGFVMTATRIVDGRQVAVKFINIEKIPRELWLPDPRSPIGDRVPAEITILQQLQHPNIIEYIDHVVEPKKYILLITELHGSEWKRAQYSTGPGSSSTLVADDCGDGPVEKKRAASDSKVQRAANLKTSTDQKPHIHKRTSFDLFECIDHHLSEPVARKIFAQIVLAVRYLQVKGLVHRDIKDENIVVDANYTIKIIDFGSATYIPKTQREYFTQFSGTTLFASPEIVQKKPYRGPEAEMWALGVLLYTMIFGENPFHNEAETAEGSLKMPKGFHLESDKDYHGGCRHLIRRMLDYTPESRITIEEVLAHEWLKSDVAFYQDAYRSFQSAA
ncbi:hypothetical protein HDU81_004926 [Chytriomyces hyalinus]|nr:hypothetical protein HDU81_004926 [Chytriomyces hyalinus]